ncbi:MAG TPA: HAD family phosphatase [Vicinamibacteria bacterium]|jgi:beta-phosphoglucomutase
MRVRGVVFDLDGTLVDNMALHTEAFTVFGRRHGLPRFDEEQRARLDGKRNADIFPVLCGRALAPEELRAYADEKEGCYRELSRGRLRLVAGLDRLLTLLEARGIPCAVATSGPAENVEHTLRETGLSHRLPVVVRGDEVPRGKPHPDIFLVAAARIGVPPRECLAFEDSPAGVAAARAAGMVEVALTTSFSRAQFLAAGVEPDRIVADFDAFLAGAGPLA